MSEKTVGKIFPGQMWVELHGAFNAMELRDLAMQIEKQYLKANPEAGVLQMKKSVHGRKN